MNIYYVYFYLRSKDSDIAPAGTPYYVGKGHKNRAWQTRRNKPKDPNCIVIVAENLTEEQAFELEKAEISRLGRVDLGTGILRNRTNGGEGSSGRIILESTRQKRKETIGSWTAEFRKQIIEKRVKKLIGQKRNDETREKMSVAQRGKRHSLESRAKISEVQKGRKQSAETKAKRSASLRGKICSDEHRRKLSESQTGRPGRPQTPEIREKIGNARRGEKQSAETIAKRVATRKANRAAGIVSDQTLYKRRLTDNESNN